MAKTLKEHKKAKQAAKTKKVNRSSESGEFVTDEFAKKHPATTYADTVPVQAWERGESVKCEKAE